MNPRSSPSRILRNHLKDQGPSLLAHRLSTALQPGSRNPLPVRPKPCTMRADDGLGCHQNEWLFPAHPGFPQQNPEQPLRSGKSSARSLNMQGSDCWRRARFSRIRSWRERKTLTRQPSRCRSHTIMAGILLNRRPSNPSLNHVFASARGLMTHRGMWGGRGRRTRLSLHSRLAPRSGALTWSTGRGRPPRPSHKETVIV